MISSIYTVAFESGKLQQGRLTVINTQKNKQPLGCQRAKLQLEDFSCILRLKLRVVQRLGTLYHLATFPGM